MMPVERRLLIKVATMYYLDNMKQGDIAEKLGVNRTTISKYLKKAMDAGIVRISIASDFYENLEAALEKKFGLKEVYIVPSNVEAEEVKTNMGKAGLAFLKRIIDDHQVVGFAWGTAMAAVSKCAAQERCNAVNADIVPLVGGPENMDSEFHVNTICYKVAAAFKARSHYLYAPAITKSPEIRNAIMEDVNYTKIIQYWDKMDIAMVGIGAPVKSSNLVWAGNFGRESIDELAQAGVIGEICSVFYDINGQVVSTGLSERIIAIPLDKLRKLKYCIGIAASPEKVPAIYGAVRGNLINVLILDEETAKLLLAYQHS